MPAPADRHPTTTLEVCAKGEAGPHNVRKRHHKSRAGCANCKQRRIKCDEIKPACANCIQHAIQCDYDRTSQPQLLPKKTSPLESISSSGPIKRSRGRPRKYFIVDQPLVSQSCASVVNSDSSRDSNVTYGEEVDASGGPSVKVDISTLRLLHHFCTSTGSTLAGNPGTPTVDRFWRITAPKMAFSHQFLLHIILSVAAVHLARLCPNESSCHLAQAEEHLSTGLAEMNNELAQLCTENCEALWIASMLVCHHTLGLGPQQHNYLGFGGEGVARWVSLFRGCRSIRDTTAEHMGQGFLAEVMAEKDDGRDGHASPLQPVDFTGSLALLRELLEQRGIDNDDNASQNAANLEAFRLLNDSFEGVYGSSDDRLRDHNGIVFVWLWRVPDGFLTSLLEKRPLALVIFAHFMVLLKTLDDHWFVEGWPKHIMREIDAVTPSKFQAWLKWPREIVDREEGS